MARQPIYDRRLQVVAYELLFRRGDGAGAGQLSTHDSWKAFTNVLIDIGIEQLVGTKQAFINVPSEILLSDAVWFLPKERVVIEILEHEEVDKSLFERVGELRAKGYHIALDDFAEDALTRPLLPFANTVKLEVLNSVPRRLVQELRDSGKVLLAEKVEDHPRFHQCQDLGFDQYQGYFFAKPAVVSSSGVGTNRFALINLLTKLQDADLTMDELERAVAADVSLAYRLLRLVNSAALGISREIDSVRQAILFLGTSRVAAYASMLVMCSMPNKPAELVKTALVRADLCERLARQCNMEQPERHFTTGLLSVLDALLDMPMEEILSQLSLADDLKQVLLDPKCDTPPARTLRAAKAYEAGNWEMAELAIGQVLDLTAGYISAVRHTEQISGAMAAA